MKYRSNTEITIEILGLIAEGSGSTGLYKITDKGLRFLAFNKLIEQSFGQLLSPSKHIEHS
jgi:hypothetical protein